MRCRLIFRTRNRQAYATRSADKSWLNVIRTIIDCRGLHIADVGCGGGIYSEAFLDLGAARVTGIDSSPAMVKTAHERFFHHSSLSFQIGDADNTGLDDDEADIVFERALIHHLPSLLSYMREAYRILHLGGCYVIQDRTPDDIGLPGSWGHIRGYFFERFPKLLRIEQSRRWTSAQVFECLAKIGFTELRQVQCWETRQRYESFESLAVDIRGRIGRSLLHELTDEEVEQLIQYIGERKLETGEIVEQDRWTFWCARKR